MSYHKGDQVYEVIDGQQRLTTINLVLSALDINRKNKLTYRARKKSNETIKNIPLFENEEKDNGIISGYGFAKNATTTTDKPNEDTKKDTNDDDTLKQILQHVASIDEKLNG